MRGDTEMFIFHLLNGMKFTFYNNLSTISKICVDLKCWQCVEYNGDDNYWIISLESPDNQSNDFNLNGEIFGLTPSRSQ